MKDYISRVFRQFLGNPYPKDTEQRVQQWIVDEQHAEEKEAFLYDYWQTLSPEAENTLQASLQAVRMKAGIPAQPKRFLMRRRFLRIAAVLLPLLLLAGGYLYYDDSFVDSSLMRVTVAYGEREQVVLPDGTTVWVNAGTTLQYPQSFAEDKRVVKLSGEAYFDVKRDEARPFIVETRKLSVRVLGTRFNVSAYPDDGQIVTTLNSGKVAVETESRKTILLNPDQQLSFDKKTHEVSLQQVESATYSAWKRGELIFDNLTLSEIVKTLERRYDIEIKTDRALLNRADRFTAKFVYAESLEQILEVVCQVTRTTCERKGNKVWLNPKSKTKEI